MNRRNVVFGLAAVLLAAASGTTVATENPAVEKETVSVAGLAPFERPQGAPVLGAFPQTGAWRARALRGIPEPLPPGLNFLNGQGAWYTPFDHPGMSAPYDLRGLHGRTVPKSPASAP